MDTLAGYIGSLCVGVIGAYLSQFLKAKIKIRYWQSHNFMYTIPNPAAALPAVAGNAPALPQPANFWLLTQSVTIQNFGRESAEWIEIVHAQKPDFFQLFPGVNFTESTSPTGEHTIRVASLAPREFFTIQFLCYTHVPQLSFIRSNAGHASVMPWMAVTRYPRWVYILIQLATIIGIGFCAYWVIKGGIFVLRSVGALSK
jgi:hypothetical protein